MNKHKKSWLIFGIIMVLLVGGITVRYMTVKQSQANAANEERRAQEKAALWLVQNYSGVKEMKISKLDKPNEFGGGDYAVDIDNINGTKRGLRIGQGSKEEFYNEGPELIVFFDDYEQVLGIKKDHDSSRTLKSVKIEYER
jgi:hypothetical protein